MDLSFFHSLLSIPSLKIYFERSLEFQYLFNKEPHQVKFVWKDKDRVSCSYPIVMKKYFKFREKSSSNGHAFMYDFLRKVPLFHFLSAEEKKRVEVTHQFFPFYQ